MMVPGTSKCLCRTVGFIPLRPNLLERAESRFDSDESLPDMDTTRWRSFVVAACTHLFLHSAFRSSELGEMSGRQLLEDDYLCNVIANINDVTIDKCNRRVLHNDHVWRRLLIYDDDIQ